MLRYLTAAALLASAIALPAIAQEATVKAPSSTTIEKNVARLTLTEQQAKTWIKKPVYSSDGNELGDVVAILRDADNTVTEMHADIGGFLGIGETRVRLTLAQFKMQDDRVVLSLTAAEAKVLPTVQK